MMGLAPLVGRNAAHDVVYDSCKSCIEDGNSTLYDNLAKRTEVTDKISRENLARLCDPRNYLGASQKMVDKVLNSADRNLLCTRKSDGKMNGHSKTTNGHGH